MNDVLDRIEAPALQTGGGGTAIPPIIDCVISTGPEDWTNEFDPIDIAHMKQMAEQAILEHKIDSDRGHAIIAVRIPYDQFDEVFHMLHVLSLDSYNELDVFGEAMADMYYFDDDIAQSPESGAAAAYFGSTDASDES